MSSDKVNKDMLRSQKEAFPARFRLDKLDEIWKAFRGTNKGSDLLNWPTFPQQSEKIEYVFDGLTWRSEVWSEFVYLQEEGRDHQYLALNIKLSKDGYLYDEHKNFTLHSDNISRHDGIGWAFLDTPKYKDSFGSMIEFAKKWLVGNPPLSGGKFWYSFAYHYDERRVDVLFWYIHPQPGKQGYPRRHIQISFEPGYPQTDLRQCATVEDL